MPILLIILLLVVIALNVLATWRIVCLDMEEFHKKLFQILLVLLIPLFMAGLVIALTAPDKRSAPWKYPKDNVETDGIEGIQDIVEIAVDVMLD